MGQINTSSYPEVYYDDFKNWHKRFESFELRVCQTVLYGKAASRDVYKMSNGMPVILRICDIETKKTLANVNKFFMFLVENRENVQKVVDCIHGEVVEISKETKQIGDFMKIFNSVLTSMPFVLKQSTNTYDIEYVDKKDTFMSKYSIGIKLVNICEWNTGLKNKEMLVSVGTRKTMSDRFLNVSDKEYLLLCDFVKYTFVLKDIVSILLHLGGHADSTYAENKLNVLDDNFFETPVVCIDPNEGAMHNSVVNLDTIENTTEQEYTASKRSENSMQGAMDMVLQQQRHDFLAITKGNTQKESSHLSDTEKKDQWVSEHKQSMTEQSKSKTGVKMCQLPSVDRHQEVVQYVKTREEESLKRKDELDEKKAEFTKIEQESKAQKQNLDSECCKKEAALELKGRRHEYRQKEFKLTINGMEKSSKGLKQQVLESTCQERTEMLPNRQTGNSYLQDRLTEQDVTTTRLEQENKQIKSDLACLKAEYDEATLTLKKSEENREELLRMLREKDTIIGQVTQDCQASDEKVETLAVELKEEKRLSEIYANELKALTDEGYKDRIASLKGETEHLRTKITVLEEKYFGVEREYENECEKLEDTERDKRETEKYLESMKAQVACWEARCCEKSEQLVQCQNKFELLMIELADKEKVIENKCKETVTLHSNQRTDEVKEITAESEDLKAKLTLRENAYHKIKCQLAESEKQLNLLRTERDKIEEQLKDKVRECENVTCQQNEKVRSIEHNNKELRQQLESIKSKWNETSTDVLQQTVVEKDGVIEHLRNVNINISKQLEDAKANLQQQQADYTATIENAKEMLHEKDTRIKSTAEANKDLFDKVTSLSNRLAEFDSIKSEQNEFLKEKETLIENLESELVHCKKEYATEVVNVTQAIRKRDGVIEELKHVIADLNEQLTDAKTSTEVLQQTVVEKDGVIEHLRTVNGNISKQLEDAKADLQQQHAKYTETIENAKKMLHEKDTRIKSTAEANKDLFDKVTSLSNRLAEFDSIKSEQSECLKEKKTIIENLKAELAHCKKEYATEVVNVTETIRKRDGVIEELKHVIADLNEQLTDAKRTLEERHLQIKEHEVSLFDMQKDMYDKEEIVHSILKENDRLNRTVTNTFTCQSKYISEVTQSDKRIAELQEMLRSNDDSVRTIQKDNDDLKAEIKFLKKECHEKDSLNQKYRQEMAEMTSRLAWEMNNKISANETSFENISIACRPLKIADEYSNLCSNAWLEAKQQLDEMQLENEVSLKFLCDILMVCRQTAGCHLDYTMRELRNLLYDPVKDGNTVDRGAAAETDVDKPELRAVPQDVVTVVGDHFRRHAAEVDIDSLIMRAVEILNEGEIMTEELRKGEAIALYIKESSRLAWQMVIQRPPMTFSQNDLNKPFKEEKEHPLAWGSQPSDTSVVRLFQYPSLLHGDTVVVKGKVLVY